MVPHGELARRHEARLQPRQQHLRNVLAYLDVKTLGQPEMFIKHDPARIDDQGQIVSEDTRKFLQGFVDRYAGWVRLLKSA